MEILCYAFLVICLAALACAIVAKKDWTVYLWIANSFFWCVNTLIRL
jgi:hypothetical protein